MKVHLLLLLLLFPVLGVAGAVWAEEDEGVEDIEAGRAVRRTTRGHAEYAVYAPKGWTGKAPSPLVIHVPLHQRMPHPIARAPVFTGPADQAAQDGFRALYAVVLLESYNKESHYSRAQPDPKRYVLLLQRDASTVKEIIDAIAAEVDVDRQSVFITGRQLGAEAALGVALQRPDLFAGVVLRETESSLTDLQNPDTALPWAILPVPEQLRSAIGLPILIGYDPTEHNGDVRVRMANGAKTLLERAGFRRLELLAGGRLSWNRPQTKEVLAWLGARASETRERSKKRAERDALLEKGTNYAKRTSLKSALQCLAKARALEAEHHLDGASDVLYADLEAQGRTRLAEADAATAAKRKAAYRKVAKLFDGTPLGDETKAVLDAME